MKEHSKRTMSIFHPKNPNQGYTIIYTNMWNENFDFEPFTNFSMYEPDKSNLKTIYCIYKSPRFQYTIIYK